jgi:amidohydrolase
VSTTSAKDMAAQVIDRHLADLVALSHSVHATPELCFHETASAKSVAKALRAGGLEVEEGVYDLPTALEARSGTGDLVVAVCAEYDALPGVGHACGHNIIAASAVGAGLALAAVADDIGVEVRVLGTPAEEGGGGKVLMLDRGAFADVHAAMMIHPWPVDRLTGSCLAVSHFDVHFSGREAHASAAPWEGINALDAMTIAQVSLGLLRQQLRPGDQVHGVITEGGGAANVIAASVTGRFMVRSLTVAGLAALEPRIRACFDAGAMATGCTVTYEELSPVYTHMEADAELLGFYRANAEVLGRTFEADDADAPLPTFSTDMANVSLVVPTIHPLVRIETNGAVNHQHEFAAACITRSADAAVRDGALALAWTAIDAASDPAVRSRLLAAALERQAT